MSSVNIKKDGKWVGSPILGFKIGEENLTDELKEKIKNAGGASLELDTTLSKEGKAADAKAVGDAIDAITADSIGALDIATRGAQIEANTNLDTLTDVGTYFSTGSSVSSTLLNCPYTTGGFKLQVEQSYMVRGKIQKIITGANTSPHYIRVINDTNSGSWSNWRVYYDSGNPPTAEDVGATSTELLWENASPTSDFSAQTISVALSSYEKALIYYFDNNNANTGLCEISAIVRIGNKFKLITHDGFVEYRKGTANTAGITFEDAHYASTYGQGTSSNPVLNNYIIPIAIYGIKGVQ